MSKFKFTFDKTITFSGFPYTSKLLSTFQNANLLFTFTISDFELTHID